MDHTVVATKRVLADVNRITVGLGAFWVVLMLILVGCDGEAQRIREINELIEAAGDEKTTLSAEVDALDIKDGDCINSTLPEGVSIETVVIVPCVGPWQYRVLSSFDVIDSGRYPRENVFHRRALETCDRRFTYMLFPLAESWRVGDRTVNCLQERFGLSVVDSAKLDRLIASHSLRLGECFNEAPETGGFQVELVDCSGTWQYRVLNSFDVAGIDNYQGETFFQQRARERCDPRYTEFFFPDAENWEVGDRAVNCLQESFGLSVVDPDKLDRLVDSDSLGFGECFNEAPETGGVQVELVDCSGTWQYRVLNSFDVAEIDAYPGEDFFQQRARERCDPRYTEFFFPYAENWKGGDRAVNCVQESFGLSVVDPDKLDRLVSLDSLGFSECFNEALETGELQVELVDCSGTWQYRVLNSFDVAESGVYPGESFFEQIAIERCHEESTRFQFPSIETWGLGNRTVICLQQSP